MTTIVKRLFVFALAGFMLVFMIGGGRTHAQDSSQATPAATQAANTNLPAAQPVIKGTVSGSQTQVTGVAGSYCWPQATASTAECDVVDNPQPTAGVTVNSGDDILFTTDPAAPGPASLKGILPDDKTADGGQPQVDFTATGGIFTVDDSLSAGPHRLQITAVYPGDVEGNQPFVTYVFLLNVGTGAASATTEATAVVAVLPTVEQASTASAEPPTIEPTGTEAAVQPTVAPILPSETQTAVQPTVAAETATTEPPTIEPTATIPPTSEPPTAENTVAPTVAQPTVAATPIPPTAASGAGTNVTVPEINVPPASLIVNGRTFEPIAVNTCVQGAQGETVCINRPTNATVQRVFAAAGDVAQINFQGPRPTSITVTQLSSDGTKTIGKQSLPGDNLVLYTLPSANGNFVLDIQIVYPQGKVDYFFRLVIGG